MRAWSARLGAGLLAVVAGGLMVTTQGGALPDAQAATCSGSTGVSVVVDFQELGGSTVTACAPNGGGKSATAIFAEVGVQLTYATRQPGFVCRVNGAPSTDPCVNTSPANAYWALWWGDGESSSWKLSSQGASSTVVPDGGSVAWSWQQDRTAGNSVPPGVAVPLTGGVTPTPTPTATPTPTPTPTATPSPTVPTSPPKDQGGGKNGSQSGGDGGGTKSDEGSGSTGQTPNPSEGPTPSASDEAQPGSPSESTAPEATEVPSTERDLPGESPSDSADTRGAVSGSESPSDSPASATSSEAAQPDEPARVPAFVTWGVVALLAGAIATSAAVSRRRRAG